jgi:hypothetical protein
MSEYVIRQQGDRFLVMKQNERRGYEPEVTYYVKGVTCDCPGGMYHRSQCKHVRMVQNHQASGNLVSLVDEFGRQYRIDFTDGIKRALLRAGL